MKMINAEYRQAIHFQRGSGISGHLRFTLICHGAASCLCKDVKVIPGIAVGERAEGPTHVVCAQIYGEDTEDKKARIRLGRWVHWAFALPFDTGEPWGTHMFPAAQFPLLLPSTWTKGPRLHLAGLLSQDLKDELRSKTHLWGGEEGQIQEEDRWGRRWCHIRSSSPVCGAEDSEPEKGPPKSFE